MRPHSGARAGQRANPGRWEKSQEGLPPRESRAKGKGSGGDKLPSPVLTLDKARLLVSSALITAHDVHNPLELDTRSDDAVRRLIFRMLRTQKVQKSILDRRRALQPSQCKKRKAPTVNAGASKVAM